ncbi:kinase-like domain-containing protein [Aspergillus caelatus]|uniref:Altered inheritance of mitochondria protein 9, mitochondrial n=1 Tax=Aspergillus caelatus TaxID=61420 RepID=A0A5N7A8A1_9EURO|nr:kinase-like domain-containing protein [Aspergillus caelatus]KAE8366087.1 kinase-like domain-containing protein [Aspergillus caelatus]
MVFFLRGLKLIQRTPQIARISLLCRGKPIGREELFAYTNGHFLVDEQHQLDRRYLKFDLDALCDIAALVDGDSSRIVTTEKLEGGFSKALLMKKENGKEVIAKLPCRIAGPTSLTTACEVGVLEYVRKYTSIPAPRVFSWSSDDSNPVGAEYIIMEKAAGVPLVEQWGKMAEIDKLKLIKNLTKLEAQLAAIRFPAYGGLYRQADVNHLQCQELSGSIDPFNLFRIGPSCDRSFSTDSTADFSTQSGDLDQGPWNTLSDFGISIAMRELYQISSTHPNNKQPIFSRGSIQEQTQLLKYAMDLMQMLDSHPVLSQSAQPTLWHSDLHMGNIFVSPDESSRIVSLIDFQSLSILPLFLQAQWPVFLKPPQNYIKGFVQPELPDDFRELDEEYKTTALQEWSQSKLAKAYEVATCLENRVAHNAMNIPRVFRDFFIHCGEVSEVGAIPLRECLIEIFWNWSSLGFTGQYPYSFSAEEIATHEHQFAKYQAWHEVQHLAQECLDTDAEGWIAPQLNIEEKRRQNRELLSLYIEQMAGEKSPDEARAMWPFPGS